LRKRYSNQNKNKKKQKLESINEEEKTENDDSIKLCHAWLKIVQFLFNFKKIYTNPSTRSIDDYFKNDLNNVLQNRKKRLHFEDIDELQEFIIGKFISEKLIIILVRIVMDYELCAREMGRFAKITNRI
jgi:hypothetical protein